MSVDNKNVIDFVSLDKNGNVILTISDHLEWDTENEHLLILQDKINAYLGAIENEDLYTQYPDAKNKKIIISVVSLYTPSSDGKTFLERIEKQLKVYGYEFQFKLYSDKN